MERPDYEDLTLLEDLESNIEVLTKELNEAIQKESELEIILIHELKGKEVKDTLSPKNKFIELRNLTDRQEVEKWVDDWMRVGTEIKILNHTLRQVQGRRDSLKKKISITPN